MITVTIYLSNASDKNRSIECCANEMRLQMKANITRKIYNGQQFLSFGFKGTLEIPSLHSYLNILNINGCFSIKKSIYMSGT